MPLRLVAIKMPKAQAVKAVAEARAEAKSKQRTIQPGTLIAAEWVILVTSLDRAEYATPTRCWSSTGLRWRIEIAFKRMKSLAGLEGPPGECPEVAKAWVLCHLIAALLTEAQLAAFGDSPRRAAAHAPTCGALYRLLIAALHQRDHLNPQVCHHHRRLPAARPTLARASATTAVSSHHEPMLAPMGSDPSPLRRV